MSEINPLTNNQIFLKKIAENTGSDYDTGDVSEINPLTIDQILLKEIAANTAEQSGDIVELKGKVADNTSAIEAIVNENGCCNILDNNLPSETSGNITWTVNSDKTVTASSSGQSVSGLEHHEINHSYTLQPGTYKLSGGVDSNNYIELLETNYDYTGIIDTGDGYEFTVSSAHTYIVLLRSGNGVVNAEFKPMIYDARLNPTGYVHYSMTNRELTDAVNRGSVSVVTDGVKTWYQIFNEIYALIDMSKITNQTLVTIGSDIYRLTSVSHPHGLLLMGSGFGASGGVLYAWMQRVRIHSSDSSLFNYLSNTNVASDESNTVIPSGVIVSLYY